MPSFLVVQCCECAIFQVIQEKKSSNKFSCAICTTKQSVRKVYGNSDAAKECRAITQSLNMKQGELAEARSVESEFEPWNGATQETERGTQREASKMTAQSDSKWNRFCESAEAHQGVDEPDDPRFVTFLPNHKRSRNNGAEERGWDRKRPQNQSARKFQRGRDSAGQDGEINCTFTMKEPRSVQAFEDYGNDAENELSAMAIPGQQSRTESKFKHTGLQRQPARNPREKPSPLTASNVGGHRSTPGKLAGWGGALAGEGGLITVELSPERLQRHDRTRLSFDQPRKGTGSDQTTRGGASFLELTGASEHPGLDSDEGSDGAQQPAGQGGRHTPRAEAVSCRWSHLL